MPASELIELGAAQLGAGDGVGARDAYQRALDASTSELDMCRALVGLASAERLLSGFHAALDYLRQAEPIAADLGLERELAEIHYLRGGVLFSLGDGEGCQREHQVALDHAERCGLVEWRARALSGLADAAFMMGDLHGALWMFGEATALFDGAGLERAAAINRIMQGLCVAQARMELARAHELVDASASACQRLGDEGTAAIALVVRAFLLEIEGRSAELAPCAELAIAELRRLSIVRFEPEAMALLALARHGLGDHEGAAALGREAAVAARATALDFVGPMVLGALSRVAETEAERDAALREGEALLPANGMALNHLGFAGRALAGALERGERARVERYADLLAARLVRYGDLAYWASLVRRARSWLTSPPSTSGTGGS
ncbi:MAG TPA: hypothetical protein VMZ28_17270 [Kofleriaceae bacterium]|nr:hypothetical protein [Kofleriaceae bacterium]